jgi:hypothetical protein
MAPTKLSPSQTRAEEQAFVSQCSLDGLRAKLPLRWPTPADTPPSPKRRYRSTYIYQGFEELETWSNWEHLSDFDLVLRLIDFSGLRPVLADLLGWTSARGRTPFDPISIFLFVSWQLVNKWERAEALRNLDKPLYSDYRHRFGFEEDALPTEGGVRYFLTTLGSNSAAAGDTVTVELDHDRQVEIAIQYLNQLIVGSVALIRDAGLISPEAWERALICPDGMNHDAASQLRCGYIGDSCYQPTSTDKPRPCPAKEKEKPGCECDTLACASICRRAPARDPQARCVVYTGNNGSRAATATSEDEKGELRYGYRSIALQFAESQRRFSLVLLDDFLPANAREENPSAALLLQLQHFYPDLKPDVVVGDAGLGLRSV